MRAPVSRIGSYACVPQAHRATQELAIASISEYASRAHAFVAVVPEVPHQDTGELCTGETYQGRLWTRAECLTHLLINGTDSMWIATGDRPRMVQKMPGEWLLGSTVRVFDGKSTCCYRQHVGMQHCDRQLLVQPLLGLYGKVRACVYACVGVRVCVVCVCLRARDFHLSQLTPAAHTINL